MVKQHRAPARFLYLILYLFYYLFYYVLNSAHSFAQIYALVCVDLRTRLRGFAHSFAQIYAVVGCTCRLREPKNRRCKAWKCSPAPWLRIRSASQQNARSMQSILFPVLRSLEPRQVTPVRLGAARQDSKQPRERRCLYALVGFESESIMRTKSCTGINAPTLVSLSPPRLSMAAGGL